MSSAGKVRCDLFTNSLLTFEFQTPSDAISVSDPIRVGEGMQGYITYKVNVKVSTFSLLSLDIE